jgi:hypothetical protein
VKAASLVLWVGLAGVAAAADDAQSARDELEHQLHDMVRIPPPQVEIVFNGIDAKDYAIESASFTLDGQELAAGGEGLTRGKVLFSGTVSAGPHTFASQVVYKEDPRTVFTYMSGTKFKVPGRVEFTAQRGLRLHIKAGVHVDPAADLHSRLRPSNQVEPEMLAKLDDGSMPAELRRPKVAMAEVVDAGVAPVQVAEATPPPSADEPAPAEKRGHGSRRTSRKGVVVAAAAHDEHPQVVAAKAVETLPAQALTAESADAGAPLLVAMATPHPAVATPLPAAVLPEPDAGMSLGMKLGLVGAVMLVALVGLTLLLRRR